jgi:hypothetical protein
VVASAGGRVAQIGGARIEIIAVGWGARVTAAIGTEIIVGAGILIVARCVEEIDEAAVRDGVAGGILAGVVGRWTALFHARLARSASTGVTKSTDVAVITSQRVGGVDTLAIGWIAGVVGAKFVVVANHQGGARAAGAVEAKIIESATVTVDARVGIVVGVALRMPLRYE